MSEKLLEWARRRAGAEAAAMPNALEALRSGEAPAAISARLGLPAAAVEAVRTYYDLLGADTPVHCTGTACSFPGGAARPRSGERGIHCAGRCYEAPSRLEPGPHPVPRRALAGPAVVLRHLVGRGPLEDAELPALYALPPPDEILERIERSGLRGRGGAAYPTAAKWRAARAAPGRERFVIANGDEGDPGSFVDRLLLEEDPHAVLAGLQACAHAIGARRGIVYVRGEYPYAAERVDAAISHARARGLLLPGLSLEIHVGAGSYVCGEETALIASIEGLRAESRPKPPYPAERGLHGCPTVVQNVETLAVVPAVLAGARPATKAFSVSGAVVSPGAVEAPLGTPLRTLLEEGAGGAPPGRRWKMALVGGPMGRVVPAHGFDVPLSFDALPGLGHGGIVVLDETVSAAALAAHLHDFAASESCGACTPCRIGTRLLARMDERPALERLLDTLELGSLCGFGQGVPRPLRDLLAHFPDELFARRSS